MNAKSRFSLALLSLACATIIAAQPNIDRAALDNALSKLPQIQFGDDRALVALIDDAVRVAGTDKPLRAELEKKFIRMLKPDTTPAAKDYTCRALRLMGSSDCVPALAALLPDENLNSLARYALENIPGTAADRTFRNALPKTTGRAKIGIISSLGFRRDAKAVGDLTKLLGNSDTAIANAAAIALGKIGTTDAAKSLTKFRPQAPEPIKAAVTQACLQAADQLLRSGNQHEAAAVYAALFDQTTGHIHLAAYRGLVASKPAEANSRLLNALSGDDTLMRNYAARLIAESPTTHVPSVFLDALPKLSPNSQIALLGALEIRADVSSRATVAPLLKESQNAEVRQAAIETLAAVADASDIVTFARVAATTDGAERESARKVLAGHRGEFVNPAIIAALQTADAAVQIELLRSLSARNASSTAATVLKFVNSRSPKVSRAATQTLGAIGNEQQVGELVQLLGTADESRRESIADALASICGRVHDKAADAVLAGLKGGDVASRCALLRVLGSVGGPKALQSAQTALQDSESAIKEAAIRALAEWPNADAGPDLLQVVRTTDNQSLRALAFRGFVRLGRESEAPAEARLKMLSDAMDAAKSADEKKLVLGALGTVYSEESLKLVNRYVNDPDLAEEAKAAAGQITGKLGKTGK